MLKRILIACLLAASAAGCEYRTEPSATRVAPTAEKNSDVHIQTPGVKIDIEKKNR